MSDHDPFDGIYDAIPHGQKPVEAPEDETPTKPADDAERVGHDHVEGGHIEPRRSKPRRK